MHPRPRQKHHTPYRWPCMRYAQRFSELIVKPISCAWPDYKKLCPRPFQRNHMPYRKRCWGYTKQLQGLLTNAQDLIGVRWGCVIIFRIPSCPHLYNKTHPRFSLNTETVLAARVKVHKARRVIHTNAGNSCFCYSSHQFNETWSDQIKKKEVLENCTLVDLGC